MGFNSGFKGLIFLSYLVHKPTKTEPVSLQNLINKDSDLQRRDSPFLDKLFPTSGRDVQPFPSWTGLSLKMGHNVPSKCREPLTKLHIPEDSNTAVRT